MTPPSAVDPAAHPDNRIGTAPPRTRMWRDGELVDEGFPVYQVSDRLAEPGVLVWLDLCGPAPGDLRVISDELGLHGVSVEDAVSAHERAKLDRYADYLFLNVYISGLDATGLSLHEVSAFITPKALVTVRQDETCDVDGLVRRWDEGTEVAGHGVARLLHGLLDLVVDRHFETIQALDDEAGELEDLLFDDGPAMRAMQRRSFELRKNLMHLRKVVLPMREIVDTLLHRDPHLVDAPLVPYFQDVYDHALRAAEWIEGLRDLVANLLDTRLALQDTQRNEVMKKVTSWAAIIAVPTAVTGFYGQNVPYPGLQEYWGFVTSAIIMIAASITLYLVFKRRDWL